MRLRQPIYMAIFFFLVQAAEAFGAAIHADDGYAQPRCESTSWPGEVVVQPASGDGQESQIERSLSERLAVSGRAVYLLGEAHSGEPGGPENSVEWEFTHPDLGYIFSDMQVARLGDGKRYVIFGNGYSAEDSDGSAQLFLVNIEDPSDYLAVETHIGHTSGGACADSGSDCNGLSSPELADLNDDGIVDWAYAGDLHGNVWAFNLPKANGALNIAATRLFSSCAEPLINGESCQTVHRQPITSRVALARNPRLYGDLDTPNINVYWGTGQRLTAADVADTSAQAFYSVLHTGSESGSAAPAYYHSDLAKRFYTRWNGEDGNADARSVEGVDRVSYQGTGDARQYGWTIALPGTGERLLSRPVIVGDVVAFNSMLPDSDGPCDVGASGWVNILSLADGLTPGRSTSAVSSDDVERISGDPLFDYNDDGVFDADDRLGDNGDNTVLSMRVLGEPGLPSIVGDAQHVSIANGGSSDSDAVLTLRMQLDEPGRVGRVSWYQLR